MSKVDEAILELSRESGELTQSFTTLRGVFTTAIDNLNTTIRELRDNPALAERLTGVVGDLDTIQRGMDAFAAAISEGSSTSTESTTTTETTTSTTGTTTTT